MTRKRLFVLGNCQAATYERAFRQLLPDWDVAGFTAMAHNRAQWPSVTDRVEAADAVICLQPIAAHPEFADLMDRLDKATTVMLPGFSSFRYHPDFTLVRHNGQPLRHQGIVFHSATVLMAYQRGVEAARICQILNDPDLPLLGELGQDEEVERSTARAFDRIGVDVASLLPRWSRRGAFMHIPNHPIARVLTDIAQQVALAQGWTRQRAPVEPDFADPIDGGALPIYASVARAFGIPTRPYFRLRQRQYALRDWIDLSYQTYRTWEDEGLLPELKPHRDLDPHLAALF